MMVKPEARKIDVSLLDCEDIVSLSLFSGQLTGSPGGPWIKE